MRTEFQCNKDPTWLVKYIKFCHVSFNYTINGHFWQFFHWKRFHHSIVIHGIYPHSSPMWDWRNLPLKKKYSKGLYHLHVASNTKALTTTNCESQTNKPGTGKTLRWYSPSSYFLSCNKLTFRYLEKGNMSSFNTPKL